MALLASYADPADVALALNALQLAQIPVDRRLVIERFPDDVAVIDQSDIANWLVNRPEQFNKRQVLAAFEAARETTLWTPRFAS